MRSFKKYLEESSLLQEAEFKIQEKDTTVKKVLEKVSRIQDKEHTYVKVAVLDKNANVESRVYNIEDVTAPSSKRANRTARVKKLTLEYDESVQDEMTLAEFEGILNEYASDESIDARKVLIQAEGSGIVREMNVVFYYDDETNVVFFCVGGYAKLDSVRAFVTRLKAAAAATDNVEGTGSNATADLTDDAREEAVQAVQDGEAPNPNDMPEQTAAQTVTLAQLEQAFDQADGNDVDWQALQQATRPQQTSQPARTRATRLTPEQVNAIAESLQAMVAADEEYSDLQVSFVSVPTSIPRQLISQFNGKKYAIAIQFQGAAPNRRVFYMVGEEAENFLRDMALDDICARLKAKVGEQTDVEYTVAIHFVTEA